MFIQIQEKKAANTPKFFEEEYRQWIMDNEELIIEEGKEQYWNYLNKIDVSATTQRLFLY